MELFLAEPDRPAFIFHNSSFFPSFPSSSGWAHRKTAVASLGSGARSPLRHSHSKKTEWFLHKMSLQQSPIDLSSKQEIQLIVKLRLISIGMYIHKVVWGIEVIHRTNG